MDIGGAGCRWILIHGVFDTLAMGQSDRLAGQMSTGKQCVLRIGCISLFRAILAADQYFKNFGPFHWELAKEKRG